MIIVSHRGPVSFTAADGGEFDAQRGAGGVVSGLAPLLAGTGATWVAAAISDDDRAALQAGRATVEDFDLVLLGLDPRLHSLHYDVVSNATLWMLHHGMFDLVRRPRFDRRFREAWEAYVTVNEAFAAAVAGSADDGDAVLVQDYQLALVPGLLRATRPDLKVVHFTHTPFCGPDGIRVLPEFVSSSLCRSMVSVACGFHTQRWARSFEASVREVLGDDEPAPWVFHAPLGPDPAHLAEAAADPTARAAAQALDDLAGDRTLLVRVDRMEPSKNIVRGFVAYDLLLEEHPEWRERVVFVALAYPSRENLAEYLAYRQEVEQAAGRVNERWGTSGWEPVVLDTNDDYPTSVAALSRYDVLLVNPILDGLNMVAKEGPLLNERDGVLCLSRGAGAFVELGPAALEVYPFDVLQTAETLLAALTMAKDERTERADRLRKLAAARTPSTWLDDQLARTR